MERPHKEYPQESQEQGPDPFEALEFFEDNKFDSEIMERFEEMTKGDPRNFFSDEVLNQLYNVDQGTRTILLARASMHVTTRPSDVDVYLGHFPGDAEVLKTMVSTYSSGRSPDGITFVFTSLLSDRFPESNRNAQMSEIYERRELAPDYLLKGYECNMGSARIEAEFGEAGRGYVEASQEASELEFAGARPFERRTPFDTPEFESLNESEKSRMLRLCLGTQQLGMVFNEALNSAFTREFFERQRARNRQRAHSPYAAMTYDPAHSMLYGTEQPNSVYEMPQSRFEQEMSSTAEIGGFVEEYAEHKLTLATIEAFSKREPDPENVSLLVDFWNKNRNPIFGNAVAEALSIQGPEQASQEILALIRTETRNKNALASILYRLELGKIGMSEEGVRYMGRLYNLGELNNPDFFVNRLSPQGEVGVFNEERELLGFFELGDLSDGQTEIATKVRALTYENLFKDRGDVSEEERARRERFVTEFNQKYFDSYHSDFFEGTGVRFNNLTLEEQGWFLSFVGDTRLTSETESNQETETEVGEFLGQGNYHASVRDFVIRFGENGIRSFLSMEFDRDMGHHVMENIAASPKADEILALYNHLIIAGRKTVSELRDKISPEVADKLESNLLRRAKDTLASDISDDAVLQALEKIRVENAIFTTAFRTLRTEGEITEAEDVALMEAASFESVPSTILPPSDRAKMLKIFDAFWNSEPIEFSSKVRAGLEASFSRPETSFFVLRHNGEIVGYARVDDKQDSAEPHMYFGSFNVDESYSGAKIGEVIYRELIKQSILKYDRIEADCDPYSDISKFYLRDFVATEYYLAEGVKPSLHIVYDKEEHSRAVGPTMTQQEVIQHAELGNYTSGEVIIREIGAQDEFPELDSGMILTRYLSSQDTGNTYGVFEKGHQTQSAEDEEERRAA